MIDPSGHGGNGLQVQRLLRTLYSTSCPIVAFNERLQLIIGRTTNTSDVSGMTFWVTLKRNQLKYKLAEGKGNMEWAVRAGGMAM